MYFVNHSKNVCSIDNAHMIWKYKFAVHTCKIQINLGFRNLSNIQTGSSDGKQQDFSIWLFWWGGKGQMKPKADMRIVDSPKKWMKEFGFFAVKSKKATKTNLFVRFLGESAACQSAFGFIWPLLNAN